MVPAGLCASGRGAGEGQGAPLGAPRRKKPLSPPPKCHFSAGVGAASRRGTTGTRKPAGRRQGRGSQQAEGQLRQFAPHPVLPSATGHLLSPARDVMMARARRVLRADIVSSEQHGARSLCFVLRSYS